MALVRGRIPWAWRAVDLGRGAGGERVRVAGQVICRQRPGTANGHLFLSLEDETGVANVFVARGIFERHRLVITQEAFLEVEGVLEVSRGVRSVTAEEVRALAEAPGVATLSHDFH
jgi:error-prone DNA polymerase